MNITVIVIVRLSVLEANSFDFDSKCVAWDTCLCYFRVKLVSFETSSSIYVDLCTRQRKLLSSEYRVCVDIFSILLRACP